MSQDENNSAICPISLFNSLAMVYAGTSGKNAKEIEKVLNIESDSTVLLENIKQLLNRIKTFENTYHKFIRIPSRIFYNRNDNLKNNYIKLITKCFGQNCKPEGITCKDTSAMQINEWIRRETNNRILQIVLAYQLNQSLKLILCSAFYFRTDWKYPFKKERTRRNYFYINPNNRIYIPFMAKLRQFRYRDDTDLACEIVELPFGHGLCMYILLPHQINGLNSLCQRIDFTTIEMITSSLQFRDMQVFLPRFRIHYQYDPLKTLQSIGMIKAFRERHDNVAFGRMTNNLKYSISMINHEIIIDVNEGPQLPKKLPKNLPNQPYWYYDILTNEIYTMESSIDYNNPGYVRWYNYSLLLFFIRY